MKIGIGLPNAIPSVSGSTLIDWARRAEERGFDSLGVIDRVVYDSYDPVITLALAAAVTERIELVTNVVIAPLRSTAQLAKQAASLDRASNGRLTLGLAAGGRDDDFAASRVALRGRGRAFETQLRELRKIWRDAGRPGGIGPAPVRAGGPALMIGGGAAIVADRVARHGAGWTMMVGTPEQFAEGVDTVGQAWRAIARPGQPRTTAVFYAALGPDAERTAAADLRHYYAWLGAQVTDFIVDTAAVTEDAIARRLEAYREAGADEVLINPCSADPSQLDRIADVALRLPALI